MHVITSSCPARGFLGLVLIDRDFGGTEGNIKKEKLNFRVIEGNFQQDKSNLEENKGNIKQKEKLKFGRTKGNFKWSKSKEIFDKR